jgi:hypothetical protein
LANPAYGTRQHLEPAEVEAIAEAARREGIRDWLMIVMTTVTGCGWGSRARCAGLTFIFGTVTLTCGA